VADDVLPGGVAVGRRIESLRMYAQNLQSYMYCTANRINLIVITTNNTYPLLLTNPVLQSKDIGFPYLLNIQLIYWLS
jgi:hypothetical protein